ncbi:hypothetical protein ACFX2U_11200 [Gilliamella apicola]|uniref:hypothetical protein n=1 Tax=Gilliamella apicola TaxID=1196095 RepID=UPI0039863F7B
MSIDDFYKIITIIIVNFGIPSHYDFPLNIVLLRRKELNLYWQELPHNLLAIKRLNIPTNYAIVFEDSSSDVKSAVAAGSYCVGIGDDNLLSVGAKFTITDFTAVKIITQSNGQIIISFDNKHQLTYVNP